MNKTETKPTILWILQENQVTPLILDFLKLAKKGIEKIDIQILVPATDTGTLEMVKELNPIPFQPERKINDTQGNYETFNRKRELLEDLEFPDGLKAWRVLILDDLGGGKTAQTTLHTQAFSNIIGIILQIPTPLGSSTQEEFIFYAWVNLARRNHVYIAGYELLPLDTRWTLLPSMLDGVITTNKRSFDVLSRKENNIPGKIWKLPRHEGKVFSPGTSNLWRNGLQAPYHYRIRHKIPKDKTILFIPHNVAMSYEYRRLLEEMAEFAGDIHLMFSIGKDQIRGTHSQDEIITTISHGTLEKFHSYSFHELNAPHEMIMADAVVGCSACYSTKVAEANGIPCIVIDETVPPCHNGYLVTVNHFQELRTSIQEVMAERKETTDVTDIIYQISKGEQKKNQH